MAKKALLVGVNDYAPIGAGGPDLRGCVNDVKDMANTLNVLGIVPAAPAKMKILTDARATRAAILKGLGWLVAKAKKGDTLIFFYSGHGSYVADVDKDEIDKKDEAICPHDYATAGMMRDDDLRGAFSELPVGANLDVFLDSCFSGTGTRELGALAAASAENQLTYRYIEPPTDYGFFLDSDPTIPVRGILKPSKGEKQVVLVRGLNHVLWSGCRDNQTSAEAPIDGVYRGIFTYALCKVLRGAGPGVTRRQADARTCAYIRGLDYAQVPQLEGTEASIRQKVFT